MGKWVEIKKSSRVAKKVAKLNWRKFLYHDKESNKEKNDAEKYELYSEEHSEEEIFY